MSDAPRSTGSIVIEQASTPETREAVFSFRYDVYIDEMRKAMSACVDHGKQWILDAFDDDAEIFTASIGGQLVGTLRSNIVKIDQLPDEMQQGHLLDRFEMFDPGQLSMTSRLMVAEAYRKTLALPRLLMAVYEYRLVGGAVFDFCNCTPELVPLYQGLGYRRYTEEPVDTEIGFRVPLVMMVGGAAHLEKIRSPFWRILKKQPQLFADAELADWFELAFPISEEPQPWELDENAFWQQMASNHSLNHRFGALRVVNGQLVSTPIEDIENDADKDAGK